MLQRSKRSGLKKSGLELRVGLPSIFQVEDIYSQILQLAEVCLCGECLCCRMQGPSRHKELHIHHHGHAFTFIALSSPPMLYLCLSSWQPLHYLPQPLPHAQNGVEDIPKTPGQTQLLPCHRSFFLRDQKQFSNLMPIPETWCQFRNLILEWVLPEWIPMYWNPSTFEFESTSWLETQVEFVHGTPDSEMITTEL